MVFCQSGRRQTPAAFSVLLRRLNYLNIRIASLLYLGLNNSLNRFSEAGWCLVKFLFKDSVKILTAAKSA